MEMLHLWPPTDVTWKQFVHLHRNGWDLAFFSTETTKLWKEFTSVKRKVLINVEDETRISVSSIQFGDENSQFPSRYYFATEVRMNSYKHTLEGILHRRSTRGFGSPPRWNGVLDRRRLSPTLFLFKNVDEQENGSDEELVSVQGLCNTNSPTTSRTPGKEQRKRLQLAEKKN